MAMIPAQITSGSTVYVHKIISNGDYYCALGKEDDPAHQWKYNVAKNQNNTVYFSNKTSQGSVWVLPDLNAPEGSGDPIMVTKGEVPRAVKGGGSSSVNRSSAASSVTAADTRAAGSTARNTIAADQGTVGSTTGAGASTGATSEMDVRARLQEQIKARLLQRQQGGASAASFSGGSRPDTPAEAQTPAASTSRSAHKDPSDFSGAETPTFTFRADTSVADTSHGQSQNNVELSPLTNNDFDVSPRRALGEGSDDDHDDVEDINNNNNSMDDSTAANGRGRGGRKGGGGRERGASSSLGGAGGNGGLSRLEALRQKRALSSGGGGGGGASSGANTPRSNVSPSPQPYTNSTFADVTSNNQNPRNWEDHNEEHNPSQSIGSSSAASGGKMSARERLALYRQRKVVGGGSSSGQATPNRANSLTPSPAEDNGSGRFAHRHDTLDGTGGGGAVGRDAAVATPLPHHPASVPSPTPQRTQQGGGRDAPLNLNPGGQWDGGVRGGDDEGSTNYYVDDLIAEAKRAADALEKAATKTNGGEGGGEGGGGAVVSGGTNAFQHSAAAAILAEKQRQLLLNDEVLQREKAELIRAERLAIEHKRRALAIKAAEEEALLKVMEKRRRMEEERLQIEAREAALAVGARRQRKHSQANGEGGALIDAYGDVEDDDDDDIAAEALRLLEEEKRKFKMEQDGHRKRADIARSRALNYSDAVAEALRLAVEEQAKERERLRSIKDAELEEERARVELALSQRLASEEEAYFSAATSPSGGGSGVTNKENENISNMSVTKPTRYPKALVAPFSSQYKYIGTALLSPQEYQARALLDATAHGTQKGGGGGHPLGLNTTIKGATAYGSDRPSFSAEASFGLRSGASLNSGASSEQGNPALTRFLSTTDSFISNSSSRAVLAAAGAMSNPRGGLVSTSPTKGPAAPFPSAANGKQATTAATATQQFSDRESLRAIKDGKGVMYYRAKDEGLHDVKILDSYAKAAAKEEANRNAVADSNDGTSAVVGGEENPFRVLEALSFYEGEWDNDVPSGVGTLSAPGAAYHGNFEKGKPHGRGTLQTRKLYASMDFEKGSARGSAVVETSAGETFAGVVDKNKITTPGSLTLAQQQQQSRSEVTSPTSVAADMMEWVWEGSSSPAPSSLMEKENRKGHHRSHAEPSTNIGGTGQARIRYANGDLYVGPVVDYKPHGKDGCYRFRDGTTYSGAFDKGTISGVGTYRFESGNVYEGEVREGLFHGKGTYTRVDEFTYAGMWADGRMHGPATVTFSNGDVWEGQFVKDVKGEGRYVKSAQFLLAPARD